MPSNYKNRRIGRAKVTFLNWKPQNSCGTILYDPLQFTNFSVSHINGNEIGFTIAPRGKMTHDIIENARLGDYIGLTGPLGMDSLSACEQPLLIGGGVDLRQLPLRINCFTKKKATILLGARTGFTIPIRNHLKTLRIMRFNGSPTTQALHDKALLPKASKCDCTIQTRCKFSFVDRKDDGKSERNNPLNRPIH